jgi:hypothetical protein
MAMAMAMAMVMDSATDVSHSASEKFPLKSEELTSQFP